MRALPFGPRDAQRHRVPAIGPPPRPAHAARIRRRIAGCPHPQPWRTGLRDNEIPDTAVAFVPRDVHLKTVRMDVVRLVVEAQRRRVSGPNAQLGLHDVDRQVERVVVPGRVRDGGKVVRARVGLLAAAILILELEPERLARVKSVERPVEWRGRARAPRRPARTRPRGRTASRGAARPPPLSPPPPPPPAPLPPPPTPPRPRPREVSCSPDPSPPSPRRAIAAREHAPDGSAALSHRA